MDHERRVLEQLELLNRNMKEANDHLCTIEGQLGDLERLMRAQKKP